MHFMNKLKKSHKYTLLSGVALSVLLAGVTLSTSSAFADCELSATNVAASAGGACTLARDTVYNSPDDVVVFATGSGSKITTKAGVNIALTITSTSSAPNAKAISSTDGAAITLTGPVSVTTEGPSTDGLFSSGAGSEITINGNYTATLKGASGNAVHASTGGFIVINGKTTYIASSGSLGDSHQGVYAEGGTVVLNGDYDFQSSLSGSHAILATDGGSVKSNGTLKVVTSGSNASGVYVTGGGSADLNNTNITISHTDAAGIQIGKSSPGLTGTGNVNSLGELNITLLGAQASAIYIEGQSAMKADFATSSTTIETEGYGIMFGADTNPANATVSTVSLSNANITATGTNDVVLVSGNVKTGSSLTVTNGTMKASDTGGYLINVKDNIDVSDFTFNASNMTLSGLTNIAGSSKLTLNLTDATVWNLTSNATTADTGSFTTVNLKSGSKIDAHTGSYTLTGDINSDSGIIDLVGNAPITAAAGKVLTIAGNYSGANGALVRIGTVLGDDNSTTDLLHITGNASGETGVEVTNRDGLGALTTGNGIKVVQVDGTSTADNFFLKSDYIYDGKAAVVGGAYAYSLYPDDLTGAVDGDWYLRSLYKGPTKGDPNNPVLQPGVPLYETYPSLLLKLNDLGTLRQRVGSRFQLQDGDHVPAEDTWSWKGRPGFWMVVEGITGHDNPARSTSHADYDSDIIRTKLGLDVTFSETEKGKLVGGAYFQYGHAKADVKSRFGRGTIKTNGYGIGGTLTWYGNDDLYIDGVGQVMWFDSNIHSRTLNRAEINNNDGIGYALSIETGKQFRINDELAAIPQAQLKYNSVDFDNFTDAYGARVKRKDGDSLVARLGVELERKKNWLSADGVAHNLKTYVIGNLYYEFLDGTEVSVTDVEFNSRSERFWGGIGAGVSHDWNNNARAVFGEVDARSPFTDFGNSYSLFGNVGFRSKF